MEPTPEPSDPTLVTRRTVLEVPPGEAWRLVTDPDELAAWWGPGTEIDVAPGGPARTVEDDGAEREGVVAEVEPGRLLRVDLWPADPDDDAPATRITIELEPCPFGTVVTVTEAVLADLVVHPPVFLGPPPVARTFRPGPGWRAGGPVRVLARA